MARQDFALFQNDLLIKNGDIVIGESDQQHIMDTINALPGWWKQYPADGVGVVRFLGSSGTEQRIARLVKMNLISDGYTVSNPDVTIDIPSGEVFINPNAS